MFSSLAPKAAWRNPCGCSIYLLIVTSTSSPRHLCLGLGFTRHREGSETENTQVELVSQVLQ